MNTANKHGAMHHNTALPLVLSQPGLGPATADLAAARLGLHGAKTETDREHGAMNTANKHGAIRNTNE